VFLGAESGVVNSDTITVCVNGNPTEYSGAIDPSAPRPHSPAYSFSVPLSATSRGYNVVALVSTNEIQLEWVEIAIH